MTSLLRQLVAGPRSQHAETGLDLCYVTPNIIATSGPSQTYPQRAYRNPLDRLVGFLDSEHGDGWAIWEFRAEGTGYPDEAVHNRIRHYPFPDHHPPPFRLVPMIVASMRDWLNGAPLDGGDGAGSNGNSSSSAADAAGKKDDGAGDRKDGGKKAPERVVVVHCKAGKGRSGTMACSYLIAECGWSPEDALARFTERRMRPQFGAGVSIPSQLRWIGYVDRWTRGGKRFADRAVEVVEVHIWGLRHGVKVSVEGFVDEGKRIKTFHTFAAEERIVVEGGAPGSAGFMDLVSDMAGYGADTTAGDSGEGIAESGDLGEIAGGAEDEDKNNGTPSKVVSGARVTASLLKMAKSGIKHGYSKSNSSSSASLNKLKPPAKSKTIIVPDSPSVPPNNKTDSPPPADPTGPQSLSQSDLPLATPDPASPSTFAAASEPGGQAVILRPSSPIQLPSGDVRIALERRNRASPRLGAGWAVVTAVAHAWFNTFFEGGGAEDEAGRADEAGVFEIEWEAMDGIKGMSRKGSRACDRVAVVWRVIGGEGREEDAGRGGPGIVVDEPAARGPVPQMRPADWKGVSDVDPEGGMRLGLRAEDPDSAGISKASSIRSQEGGEEDVQRGPGTEAAEDESMQGVKTSGPSGEEVLGEPLGDKTAGEDGERGQGEGGQSG